MRRDISEVATAAFMFVLALLSSSCRSPEPELTAGVLLPLTPATSRQYGIWAQQGIDLAVSEVNAEEGVSGRHLRVDYQDDLNSATEAAKRMTLFTQVHHYPVVMSFMSSVTAAIAPLAAQYSTVLITNTYTPGITEGNPWVFRIGHNASTDSVVMAKFCASEMHKADLAIMYLKTPAGSLAAQILEQRYQALGGKVVAAIPYDPASRDFRSFLVPVRSSSASLLYIYPYKEVGTIIREARQLGFRGVILSNITIEDPNVMADAGAEALEGVIFTAPSMAGDLPVVSRFKEKFKARYGQEPEINSATWYDTIKVLSAAARGAGTTPDNLRRGLHAIHDFRGVTGIIDIQANGDVDRGRDVVLKTVKAGKIVLWSR